MEAASMKGSSMSMSEAAAEELESSARVDSMLDFNCKQTEGEKKLNTYSLKDVDKSCFKKYQF